MLDQMTAIKLSPGAQQLRDLLVNALKLGPIVCLDVKTFGETDGITARTAQRYARAIIDCPEFEFMKRMGAIRYYCSPGTDWRSLLAEDHDFVTLKSMASDPSVVSVVSVAAISYIYIFKKKEDLRKTNDTNDTDDTANDTGTSPYLVTDDPDQDAYAELVSMAAYVCKRSSDMLLEEEEQLLEKMFRHGITADGVYRRYSRDTKPNFWYSGYWKGRSNAWPMFKDIFTTWELSGDYSPQPYDTWPPLKDIQEAILAVMVECGARKPETAMARYTAAGYDIIIKNIDGGYVHMCRMSEKELKIKIATTVREIKQLARKD